MGAVMARLEKIMAQFGGADFMARPEAQRVALVKASGAVPEACGDAAPVAPARGPVRVFDFMASYPKGEDGSELKPAGHLGRRTMQRLDVFGRMAAQSRRRGGDGGLTPSQVQMGRDYRTLIEDRDSGAVRCVSAEALMLGGAGGGTREGFTDHRLALSRRIDLLQARIGPGMALRSKRADYRQPIPARVLVDLVCVQDKDLAAVLRAYGWPDDSRKITARARAALADALDRMMGPRRSGIVCVVAGTFDAPLI